MNIEKITDLPLELQKNYLESPDDYEENDVLWYLSDETHMKVVEEDIYLFKSRWETRFKSVLFDEETGKYWAFEYNRGNTEYQDDCEHDIEVYECERKIVEIFDYPRIKKS